MVWESIRPGWDLVGCRVLFVVAMRERCAFS